MNRIIVIMTWTPRKLWNIMKNIHTVLMVLKKLKTGSEQTFQYITKIIGAKTGTVSITMRSVNLVETIMFPNKIVY